MQNIAARDKLVLVLSRKILEAADIADFAKSRSLGDVIVESDVDRARDLLSKKRFSIAFIGLPDSEERSTLMRDLNARRTHIVLVDDNPGMATGAGIRVLSRPFTDADLDCAVSSPRAGLNRRSIHDHGSPAFAMSAGSPDAA